MKENALIGLRDSNEMADFFGCPTLDIMQGNDSALVGRECLNCHLNTGTSFLG
jgi:hypothetical protein